MAITIFSSSRRVIRKPNRRHRRPVSIRVLGVRSVTAITKPFSWEDDLREAQQDQ
jgi:hypothetical protein